RRQRVPGLRGEHQVQRLGRRDQDVGRLLGDAPPVLLGRVAGPRGHPQRRRRRDPGQGRPQVLLHVVGEGFQRRHVKRPAAGLGAGFEGWTEADDAAWTAVRYLRATWGGRRFAVIDDEDFFDFTSARPHVRLVDGQTRKIDWPTNEFFAAPLPGGRRDVVLLR